MIPGDLLSAFPHRQFHTLPGLLDSWAALPNSYPNACMPMQGGSLYHFYDGLWYDPRVMMSISKYSLIHSQCFYTLYVLNNKKMDNPLILQKLHLLSCAHKTIHLCWIPSHIGIRGNEAADIAAVESLDKDITISQVPYTDLKSYINRFISSKWQGRWSSCCDNKLSCLCLTADLKVIYVHDLLKIV